MVVIGRVDQPGHLVLQGGNEFRVVVAQCVDGDAAQGIQVLSTVHIPHAAALSVRKGYGQTAIGVHHVG